MDNTLPQPASDDPSEASVSTPPTPRRRKRKLHPILRSIRIATRPGRIWYYSTKAYQARLYPLAWLLKSLSFVMYKSLLSVECQIEADLDMRHFGVGCMIHPNVTIGRRVIIHHHIAIAAETWVGSPSRIIIEDDVVIGAHALIIGNNNGGLRIGKGAVIGMGAIVNRDVPPGVVVLPLPSRPVKMIKTKLNVDEPDEPTV